MGYRIKDYLMTKQTKKTKQNNNTTMKNIDKEVDKFIKKEGGKKITRKNL